MAGGGSFVKQGVTIGDGAIVGMGAVVTKDVAPYAIVGGNPAKLIRMRFDEDTIQKMLESEWWKLPNEIIKENAPYIRAPKIFLENIKKQ